MDKVKNNWILKFIFPDTDFIRTVYDDGLVYDKEYNEKIGILKSEDRIITKNSSILEKRMINNMIINNK